eukprot:12811631-Ditylum_brightwellii.AAC.1
MLLEMLEKHINSAFDPRNTEEKDDDDDENNRVYENEDNNKEAMDKDDQNESEYDFFYLPNLEKVVDKLDFYVVPCISRDGNRKIEIHQKKHADDLLRFQIVALVHCLQYQKVTMWPPKKIATV